MSTPSVRGPFSAEIYSFPSKHKDARNGKLRVRKSLHPEESRDGQCLVQIVRSGHFLYVGEEKLVLCTTN